MTKVLTDIIFAEKKMKLKDPYSGEEFIPTRSNQIYACSTNRVAHNNLKANKLRKHLAPINKLLHQSYKILSELMKNKNEEVFHKQFLLGKGISFKTHTHVGLFEEQHEYFIYEFCIKSFEPDFIKIIKTI